MILRNWTFFYYNFLNVVNLHFPDGTPSKEDKPNMQEAVLKSMPHLSGVDGEYWKRAGYELSKENKDAYVKALEKLTKEHSENDFR